MGRMRRGWELTKQSWSTLRSDRSLAAFPVLAGLTTVLLGAAFWLPAGLLFDDGQTVVGTIVGLIGLYLVTFAGVFFNVALAAAAATALDGGDATVSGGVAVARRHLKAVAGWALMLMTVNIIIRAIQERVGALGDLILGGIAVAWNLATFLAVPVITFEDEGPITTLKRSARIFRERWGEQVTGQVAVGGLVFLLALIPAAAIVGLGILVGQSVVLGVCIAIAVVILLVAAVVSAALSQIFAVALYRFATGAGATGPFAHESLAGAAAPRGGPTAPI